MAAADIDLSKSAAAPQTIDACPKTFHHINTVRFLPKGAWTTVIVTAAFTLVITVLVVTGVIKLDFSLSFNKEIKNVPKQVNKFLDQRDLDRLEEQNFQVHKGFSPPNIEGTFFADSIITQYDKIGDYQVGDSVWPYFYTFANQTSDGAIDVSYVSDNEQDKADGLGAFISGDNGCFSVYVDLKGNLNGCDYKSPQVISGCMTEAGVEDWAYSMLMKGRTKSNFCNEEMTEIDNFRIFEETDGIAERQ